MFVVVDGRSAGYSRGVTMTEFAEIFQGLGAKVAYNLDGGGSSTMYFNGELVNRPQGSSRRFAGAVPARNGYGNLLTSMVFSAVTGRRLQDTQTGLRAYPAALVEWLLDIRGERYEYELEILLAACDAGIPLVEVPITTIYIDGNRSSHIRLPQDVIRIYLPMLSPRRRPGIGHVGMSDLEAAVEAGH